jgi:hypothetical protein
MDTNLILFGVLAFIIIMFYNQMSAFQEINYPVPINDDITFLTKKDQCQFVDNNINPRGKLPAAPYLVNDLKIITPLI